jgi:hypothetical protein
MGVIVGNLSSFARSSVKSRPEDEPSPVWMNSIALLVWLRLRALFGERLSTTAGRRVIWIVAGLSVCGTTLVETPFLLHLAGTSDWQRFAVLGLGSGVMIASGVVLIVRRRRIAPTRACIAGLETAYLANMALILVVYAGAPGSFSSRSGWFVAMVIVWPMAFELLFFCPVISKAGSSREPHWGLRDSRAVLTTQRVYTGGCDGLASNFDCLWDVGRFHDDEREPAGARRAL